MTPPAWRSGRRPRTGPSTAVASLALVLLIGCSGDKPTAVTTPTSPTRVPPPTTSAPAEAQPEAEIAARYRQFWEVRFEANRDPVNSADPRFAQYAVGKQLDNVITETRQRRDQGLAIRRPNPSVYQRRVRIVKVEDDTATLQDCVTNDGVVYRVATGEVVDDSVQTRSLEASMRRVDGVWKLAETRVLQEWEGVAGCARSSDFS